jgi:uncharacterized protein (DUF305 family)
MSSRTPWITAALVAGFSLAACGTASRGPVGPAPEPGTGNQGDHSAIAKARADSLRHPYTEADVQFMSAMIEHHSQALLIASWALDHGASASIRTLAERIINGQQDEIASMQRWLRDRLKPVPQPGDTSMIHSTGSGPGGLADSGHTHTAHPGSAHGGHEMRMPGILSEAQLRQLDQARGREFDRLFLTFMIQHHRGAVTMVKDLFGMVGAARDETVFKFANDVSVDQTTEIARMEKMLAALGTAEASP